jgi:hypothetical protein
MGRRSVTKLDPQEAKQVIRRHFRRLATSSGINLAQLTAQMHEEEAVQFFVGVMRDVTAALPIRMAAADKILVYARGIPKPWFHQGETVDPNATGATGNSVAEEIEATRVTTELCVELDALVCRQVPSERWPERIRAIAGDLIAYYSEEALNGAADVP